MRSPRLAELPAPPPGKTGWPWTVETPPQAIAETPTATDGAWPRITVVTPSFNQGAFLEKTIRTVLLQGYPDLEYIVMDGGSTDDSVAIIRKYAPWLSYWTSAPDRGQAAAIRNGLERATGTVSAYLNSDDMYLAGALQAVAAKFIASPDADVVYGNLYRIDPEDRVVEEHRNAAFSRWAYLYGGAFLHQPATFWRTDAMRAAGGFDPAVRFEMDNDLFMRMALRHAQFAFVHRAVACFRIHPASKSSTIMEVSRAETEKMRQRYLPFPFNSPRGAVLRMLARVQRGLRYTVQGDLPWLVRRALSANRNQTFAK